MFGRFKRKKTNTSNTSTFRNDNKPKKYGALIFNDILHIVAKRYRDYGVQGTMISISVNPSVFASWNNVIIALCPHPHYGFEIHFRTFLAEGIEDDFETYFALLQLNINESKYRFFWEDGLVGIAYVMDCVDDFSVFEREILENIEKISFAAMQISDIFSPGYVKTIEQEYQFRFISPSKDGELCEKMVPAQLKEYHLLYEKLEGEARQRYLIKPTSVMQENNIKLTVDIIDSVEYAFVFRTMFDVKGGYTFEAREMTCHMLSKAHPRYTFFFNNNHIEMTYAVSLRCYDVVIFEKIVNDMVATRKSIYTFLNSEEMQEEVGKDNIYGSDIKLRDDETLSEEMVDKRIEVSIDVQKSSFPIEKNNIKSKRKFCSQCGSIINDYSKICTGCGKKYFKGIRLNKYSVISIILSVFLVTSVILNIVQFVDKNEMMDRTETLESEKSDLQTKLWEYQKLASFIDSYVVFVEDDGTELYHKYECYKFKGNSFWVFNTEAAIGYGYSQCPYCH